GSNAALHANETVHAAELPPLAMNTLYVLLQPGHGFTEFGPLERLLKEIRAPQTHGSQQEILRAVHIRKNDVEIGHRLLHLFERAQTLFGIERNVEQYCGLRVRVDVVKDSYREVGSHVFVRADDFRIRRTHELLADEIMKTRFGAGDDQL